jgi:hypothetical protein
MIIKKLILRVSLGRPFYIVSLGAKKNIGYQTNKIHVQLSVFDDRQLITGLPGTIVREASAYAELDIKRRDNNLYWFGPSE